MPTKIAVALAQHCREGFKKGDHISSEFLKELERIKKIRKETEISNCELSGGNDQLTADLEASKTTEEFLRSIVIRSEKRTASLREQINYQQVKASDFKNKAKEGEKHIS